MSKVLQTSLLIAIVVAGLPAYAEKVKVYDLGEIGFTTPVNVRSIKEDNEDVYQKQPKPDFKKFEERLKQVKQPSFSFHTNLPGHKGNPTKTTKYLKDRVPLTEGTKMLFFRCSDKLDPKKIKNITYGYCVSYSSLQEIKKFREKNNTAFPIQPLQDDKVCKWIGITSLPAVLTIRGAKIEIQEGL